MIENILGISELNKKEKTLLKSIVVIAMIVIILLLINRAFTSAVVENQQIESLLFAFRTFNFILCLLASISCLNSYERLRYNSVFMIGLVYLELSIGILFNQIDFLQFYYHGYEKSKYIALSTSILRMIFLTIAMNPKWKINDFLIKHKCKTFVFVVLYVIILGNIEILLDLTMTPSDNIIYIYTIILTMAYIISSVNLFIKGIKEKEYLFLVLSMSIFILGFKGFHYIVMGDIGHFYIKLNSVCFTYASSLIVIGGSFIELYVYTNRSRMLTNSLNIFHSIVDNDKHSFKIICNENGDVLYTNKKVEEYYTKLGYERSEFLRRMFKDIHSNPENAEEIVKSINKVGTWRGIISNKSDDTMLDCFMQYIDISNNKGLAISLVDISEEMKKELELEQLKIDTNERTEFMSNISHELRTPLNIFYSTVQLLDQKCSDKCDSFKALYTQYNKTLRLNCKRMLRLINNVIDISKIDTKTISSRFDNYNIICIAEDTALSVINYANLKNINIYFDTNEEERIMKCDPSLIERCMLNLLSNAIKFSPKNSSIYVNVLVNEDYTEISVKDEGIGISEKHKKVIFERFAQADKSLARQNEGSGIGLSIVKSIVDLHEGYINIDSKLGKGSTFKIILPNIVDENEECKIYDISDYNIELELSDIYEISCVN